MRVEIRLDGRRVVTTGQAVELGGRRWKNTATLRAWIAHHHIQAAGELHEDQPDQTKLYYPEDLGIDLEES